MKKDEQYHILSYSVKMHLENNYPNHLKVYTDGSLLDNQQSGSAFVIPSLKVSKTFYIGKNISIFSAELAAIVMALHYVIELPVVIFQTLFCVDSKSVLQYLQRSNSISSDTIINEILHLIHILICKGTEVTFCWVPSHCGIYGNELADRFAKRAAKNENVTEVLNIPLTLNEAFCVLKRVAWGRFEDKQKQSKSLVNCKSHFFSFDDIQKSQFLNLTDTYKF